MQCHFDTLIAVFIVHVVNDVEGIHIQLREPLHHWFEAFHDLIVIQHFASDGRILRSNLCSGFLVTTTVDRIQESFCQVGTSAEKLHLFPDLHRRHTACNTVIVTVDWTHQIIIFILD
ncbi:hypothetical protein D3C74_412290 [compost metagenome]